MIIAIDGPAGAGKSSVAQTVARELGFQLLDTGAIYRTVALVGRQSGLDWEDGQALGAMAQTLEIRFSLEGLVNRVLLSRAGDPERDITHAIRTPQMSQGASRVSAHPQVREALLDLQRRIGQAQPSVVEGRDIGTVVFPKARIKIFLTASPQERARRRHSQMVDKGLDNIPTLDEIAAEIAERDARDSQRAVAPLRPAHDAVLLDSTSMSQSEVVAQIIRLANE